MAAIILLIILVLVLIGTPDLKAKLVGSRRAIYRLIIFGVIMLQVMAYWAQDFTFTTFIVGTIFTGVLGWMEASFIASDQTITTTIWLLVVLVFGKWNTLLIAAPGGIAGIIWINLWFPAAIVLLITMAIGWLVKPRNEEE